MAVLTNNLVRFTVDEYVRMSDAGMFDRQRVELLNGRLYKMHAQANPHRAHITLDTIVLARHFGDAKRFWMVVQGTLVLSPTSAPDPDFHIFDVPVGTPDEKLPLPFLVIEVSHRTYRRDSGIKLRMYAAAGIGEYWIVNVAEKRIEVYRRPTNPTGRQIDSRYADVKHYVKGDTLHPLARPEIELSVSEMLA